MWIDLSATGPFLARSPFRDQFTWTLHKVGVDRLIFGSDYPFDEPRAAVGAVASLDFSPEEQLKIFHSNAAHLFGLR